MPSLELLIYSFSVYIFWCNTHLTCYNLSVFKNQNSGDVTNTVFGCKLLIFVYIYFADYSFFGVFITQFINNWTYHSTWSTPCSPKIYNNWFITF